MGLFDFLFRRRNSGTGHTVTELARRLGVSEQELRSIDVHYTPIRIPKRSGRGTRELMVPDAETKSMQRRILRRLLALLVAHEACHGFERGRSIVTHAARHQGKPVLVRIDIRQFFPSTSSKRIKQFFRRIGWNRDAAALLTTLCTADRGLPQGAPTSPRLANLVNYGLDARLQGLATYNGAAYSRYADDLTFSFDVDDPGRLHVFLERVRDIIGEYGYESNRRKQRVLRRHQQQRITGLVVNESVALPRKTRRWLRAVEHRMKTGGEATINESQLAGWHAFRQMVEQPAAQPR